MLSSGLTAYADRDSTWVFRAFEGDILIGWALAFQQYDGRYEYQTYVRVDWRRRGVGAKLFNAAAKRLGAEKIRYYLETPGSTEFYHHCFAPYKLKKEVVQRNKL
jgi:GNAT superfamily N-acetyltransferase